MAVLNEHPIRTCKDLRAFEAAMPPDQRLPERSTYDVFAGLAARRPAAMAITMLMTGEEDEQPRRVSAAGLLGLINQAANLFAVLAGPRPGVAFMLRPCGRPFRISCWCASPCPERRRRTA